MNVVPASPRDVAGFLALAAEVEDWFGPMVDDPEFRPVLDKKVGQQRALVVRADDAVRLLGGLLIGGTWPIYHITWLVVTETARGCGIGSALVRSALGRYRRPCSVDVITFGRGHPAAITSGARTFYQRHGFVPGPAAAPGPEGGSRQRYRLTLAG